jgi:hypothetical protein
MSAFGDKADRRHLRTGALILDRQTHRQGLGFTARGPSCHDKTRIEKVPQFIGPHQGETNELHNRQPPIFAARR